MKESRISQMLSNAGNVSVNVVRGVVRGVVHRWQACGGLCYLLVRRHRRLFGRARPLFVRLAIPKQPDEGTS